MPKRYVRGDRAFGRILKQLPDTVAAGIREQLNQQGRMLLSLMQRKVPVKTGALEEALSYRVPPVRLQLKVGLLGAATNRRLYYGRIIEFGRRRYPKARRAKDYRVIRTGSRDLLKLRDSSTRVPPHHFVYTVTRDQLYAPYRNIWDKALGKATAGASSDD